MFRPKSMQKLRMEKSRLNNVNYKSFGFTLVEILIVLALIGILSVIFFANISAISKSRDAKRKADLRQIEKALEQYRSDNGIYPKGSGIDNLKNCISSSAFGNSSCETIYLNKIPSDPKGSSYWNSGNYFYYSPSSGSMSGGKYYLAACSENTNDKDTVSKNDMAYRIQEAFGFGTDGDNAINALMITADFANSCASGYGYLIIGQ